MRWSHAAAVFVVHSFASGFVGLFLFAVAMTFGSGSPLAWPAIALGYLWFFPYGIGRFIGLPLGGIDDLGAILFNSLCWTAVMYPAWYWTRHWRRALGRRLRRIPGGLRRLVGAAVLSACGAFFGLLGPLATGGLQMYDDGTTSVAQIEFLQTRVARETLPSGSTHAALRRRWFHDFPLLCSAVGGLAGAVVGFLAFGPTRAASPPVKGGS
jgi:hypothetical protein